MSMEFKVDPSQVIKGLVQAEQKTRAAALAYAKAAGAKMVAYAKQNRPWEDRSHNARDTIDSEAKWIGDVCIVELRGNMSYSVYLEMAMEKRWAILWPTVNKMKDEIYQGYAKAIIK